MVWGIKSPEEDGDNETWYTICQDDEEKWSWQEEWGRSTNILLGKDNDKNDKDPKQISAEKEADGMMLEERETKIDSMRWELGNMLKQVGQLMGQWEGKDREILELQNLVKEKEGEMQKLQEELDRKEHKIVWVENQLKKVWMDLFETANAV
jgi:hypothetical protein